MKLSRSGGLLSYCEGRERIRLVPETQRPDALDDLGKPGRGPRAASRRVLPHAITSVSST